MKELVILSGKGGTGKTSLVSAFATIINNKVLCDADVDAADLHLILAPEIKQREKFSSGHEAVINKEKCSECGLCIELCRWEAIKENFIVDPIECEGCGVCYYFCPEKAIEFREKICGEWFISDTRFGPMVHARLGIAEENSGKLVALVRQKAREVAEKNGLNFILTDGPPGVGCPVISSIGGATAVLVVSEPTVSGIHDMERVIQLTNHFKIPAFLCINKFDLNLEKAKEIENFAYSNNIPLVGKIPFDETFIKAVVSEKSIIEFAPASPISEKIRNIWNNIRELL